MTRLGSDKRPAVARVQTMERAEVIMSLCNKRGWKSIVGIEQNRPEDISDVERLLNPPTIIKDKPKVGRNDPCRCGSGLKFKKCCLNKCRE
jgi:SWIM/SEC-C metal-binding protein